MILSVYLLRAEDDNYSFPYSEKGLIEQAQTELEEIQEDESEEIGGVSSIFTAEDAIKFYEGIGSKVELFHVDF